MNWSWPVAFAAEYHPWALPAAPRLLFLRFALRVIFRDATLRYRVALAVAEAVQKWADEERP